MPEDRLLERLEKLEGIVEATVQMLPPLIQDLSRRIDGLRGEMQGMEAKLEGRIQQAEAKLQGQIQQVEAKLQGQIQQVETKLEGRIQQVEAKLEGQIQEVKNRLESLRQEVKAEINTAFNKLMLYFTALAAALAVLTFLR